MIDTMDHSCKTYFSLTLPAESVFHQNEVQAAIQEMLGVAPACRKRRFVIGYNETYDVDVNVMLRVTLKNLMGKEDEIKELCKRFSLTATLVVVPYIKYDSEEPKPYLSLERDIIGFLQRSDTAPDLDYYVV